MNIFDPNEPEDLWRRAVEQRGRPLRLRVDRLLEEFDQTKLEAGVAESVEARLVGAGLRVRPSLLDVTVHETVTLELADQPPGAARSPQRKRPADRAQPPPPAPEPEPAEDRADAREDLEHSTLVRAAVDAERRARSAYDRAAAASAERISALERELAVEREATARARDERDELERRMHDERRQTAERLKALAAAERTARGLLEAQRAELANLTQTVRVCSAAIAQTRETLDGVQGQVKQTADDVREALTDSAALDAGDEPKAGALAPPSDSEPEPDSVAADTDEPEPVPEPAAQKTPEPAAAQRADADADADADTMQPERGEWDPATAEHEIAQTPAPEESKAGAPSRRGRGRGRLRRRPSIACVLCGRSGKAREPEQLVEAGWRVEGDVALCLTCVADDWKLAEGESVPFRSYD